VRQARAQAWPTAASPCRIFPYSALTRVTIPVTTILDHSPSVPAASNQATGSGISNHPDFVARICGAPLDALVQLRLPQAAALADRIVTIDREAVEKGSSLSALLHEEIGGICEVGARTACIRVRRDCFNGRIPPTEITRAALVALSSAAQTQVSATIALLQSRASLTREFEAAFGIESAAANMAFKSLIRNDDFAHSVLLSSATLFGQYRKYASDRSSASSKRLQLERGLLRYFARMVTKTNPFGRFSRVSAGTFDASPRVCTAVALQGDVTTHTVVRLNKGLARQLWEALAKRLPVRDAAEVIPNTTLTRDDSHIRFLAVVDGIQTFQAMEVDESLSAVIDVVTASDTMAYGQHVRRLTTDERFDMSEKEARELVDHLLKIGLLQMRGPVSAQDIEWEQTLYSALEGIEDDAVVRVRAFLVDIASSAWPTQGTWRPHSRLCTTMSASCAGLPGRATTRR
jgi:hypothetical protein